MIRDLTLKEDEAGFPIVAWTELRGFSGGGGPGATSMECRIGKEPLSGALMFLSRRHAPEGATDDGKLWHGLQGFSIGAPHARNRPRLEHELIEYLKRKFASLKIVFGETAVALQADFGREGMLEVSHSEAAATDLDHLLVLLTQSFIVGREDLMNRLCKEAFRWLIADKRLPDFSPASVALRATAEPMAESSGWMSALLTFLAAGLLAYLVYLVLLALGVVRP